MSGRKSNGRAETGTAGRGRIEFIKEGLEEFGIEKKQTIKTMLLVEEVLVKLREHAKDPDENICIILN